MNGNKKIRYFFIGFIVFVFIGIIVFHFYRYSKLRYTICLYAEDWSTVIVLIQKGIDPLAEDGYGDNAFQRAIYNAPLDTLQELVKLGVPYNRAGSNGRHPILIAAFRKRWDVVDWLLDLNGDLDRNTLRKLFFVSVEYGQIDIVPKLIKKNTSVNIYSKEGFTPLHTVFFSSELLANPNSLWEMTYLLLENGADVNALSRPNISTSDSHVGVRGSDRPQKPGIPSTPLDLAKKINNTKIIDLLEKHGAKESVREKVRRY